MPGSKLAIEITVDTADALRAAADRIEEQRAQPGTGPSVRMASVPNGEQW